MKTQEIWKSWRLKISSILKPGNVREKLVQIIGGSQSAFVLSHFGEQSREKAHSLKIAMACRFSIARLHIKWIRSWIPTNSIGPCVCVCFVACNRNPYRMTSVALEWENGRGEMDADAGSDKALQRMKSVFSFESVLLEDGNCEIKRCCSRKPESSRVATANSPLKIRTGQGKIRHSN